MAESSDTMTDGVTRQITVRDILAETRSLASTRPLFHNEADFQHALAWRLHEHWPTAQVRLETRPLPAEALYLDIWFRIGQDAWAIELKYPARGLTTVVDDERFVLRNHAAQDLLRYDFIRDIVRLEHITEQRQGVQGLALLLTNDPNLWQVSDRTDTIDAAFRLHHGQTLSGTLGWGERAGLGTTKGRETPHQLAAAYTLAWEDYSVVDGQPFRFLPVYVCNEKAEPGT
jgi:hypothetical protein